MTGSIHVLAESIDDRRPDFSPHVGNDGTVTLMFSDIEDYTGMLERLGDVAAHQLVQEHNSIVRDQTRAHGGHEVELRGDSFLLAFASSRQASSTSSDHPPQLAVSEQRILGRAPSQNLGTVLNQNFSRNKFQS